MQSVDSFGHEVSLIRSFKYCSCSTGYNLSGASSTHDKTILHTAFWGLDNLLTAANAHQHETIDHVMHEQILQKIHSHVMPMQGLGPIALKGPMRVTFTILSSKHVMIETVAPVLAASIMDALE